MAGESVSYSQRTVNRLIQLFEENMEITVCCGNADSPNSSALTNLSYYQAVLLLGIQEEMCERDFSCSLMLKL